MMINMHALDKRRLGSTALYVNALGFGGSSLGECALEDARRLLYGALDAGLNVIDTAECYGLSEEMIGKVVGHRRDEYYLFTKCGHASGFDLPDWHPQLLEKNIERSLRRLKTDHLDLIQLHSCSRHVLQQGDAIEVLQRCRDAGKARYIGYSGDRNDARCAVACGAFDVLQTTINMADQEAIDLLLPRAKEKQMGVIAKHPIANVAWKATRQRTDETGRLYRKRLAILDYPFLKGDLKDAISVALRFTLSVPGVDLALVGTTNAAHWHHNVAMLAEGMLPHEQFEQIRARWNAVTRWCRALPGSRLGWHAWV